ncbi:MAG: glycosyltransferase family 39 protein [Pseudomonadota bacterium]
MQVAPDATVEPRTPYWRNFWIIASGLIVMRIATLIATPLGIGPDEAQYWFWSRDIAFGYFSKPPMIAWAIALTTAFFGSADWAVRLSAPLFHVGAAAFLFLCARRLFDARTGFWVGVSWLLMPGVVLSSFVMATDAPLLFFWCGALYFLVRIWFDEETSIINFAALGAMIGLGLMSKYAMIYFPIALVAMLFVSAQRELLLRPALLITGLVTAAIFAPNVFWNSQHDFHTLSHTAANAHWGAGLFKPVSLVEFLGGQFAVFGLIAFTALVLFLWRAPKHIGDRRFIFLLVFAMTPLLIVAGQAFLSRAHANWAAAAYPAATLLVVGFLLAHEKMLLVKANAAFHAFLFGVFTLGVISPVMIDRVGLSSAAMDLRGWKTQTDEIMHFAADYDAVLIDDRYLMGEMLYHQRDADPPLMAIDPNASIDNHYEAFLAFDPKNAKRVLFVTTRNDASHVDYRFREIKHLGSVSASPEGDERTYTLFAISDYFGPDAGVP